MTNYGNAYISFCFTESTLTYWFLVDGFGMYFFYVSTLLDFSFFSTNILQKIASARFGGDLAIP